MHGGQVFEVPHGRLGGHVAAEDETGQADQPPVGRAPGVRGLRQPGVVGCVEVAHEDRDVALGGVVARSQLRLEVFVGGLVAGQGLDEDALPNLALGQRLAAAVEKLGLVLADAFPDEVGAELDHVFSGGVSFGRYRGSRRGE